MEADIASPTAIVEGFSYAGELTIIAGSPKAGKGLVTTQIPGSPTVDAAAFVAGRAKIY